MCIRDSISTAVITDDLARRLFGTTEEVVGRSFSLNYIVYRVCGVVRSASYLSSKSYAQLYIPYTVSPDYSSPKYDLPYLGGAPVVAVGFFDKGSAFGLSIAFVVEVGISQ